MIMWIIKLAWKNIWRNKARTAITISAIYFAVILSTIAESLKQGIFDNLVNNIVSIYTGYIQIHKKGYYEEQILDNSFSQSSLIEKKVKSIGNIRNISPRLESFALVSSDALTKGCLVVGVLPETEDSITLLKTKLIRGMYLNKNDPDVLLTEGLSERLKISLNDTVYLITQGYHGATSAAKYRVKGILKFGSPQLNDKMLYMSLYNAQNFFESPGMITTYILSVKNKERLQSTLQSVKKMINGKYEIMSWEEMMPEIKQHIETDSNNMKAVQGVLYLLITFGIFGTILMMMMERKYEMGLLLAIGMKKSKMITLFIVESVITVFAGCIAGLLSAIPIVYYLKKHPIGMSGETARAYERFGFEAIFPASTHASIFIYQMFIVLIIGLGLSVYPVIKVMNLNVVDSMKK